MECKFCGKYFNLLTDGGEQVIVLKHKTPGIIYEENPVWRCQECKNDNINITLYGAKIKCNFDKDKKFDLIKVDEK